MEEKPPQTPPSSTLYYQTPHPQTDKQPSKPSVKWWTLGAVCLGIFMLLIDVTIVNVALPDIQKAFNSSFTSLQWVVDAYALTLASFVLNAGSLADRYGRKRLFLFGVTIFTAASAACGAAPSDTWLILARAAQGIGGAIMFATSLALLAASFHGRERGTAFGIWGAVTGAAVAIGPLAGGFLTTAISWHWIFYINVPIGLATLLITLFRVRESRDPGAGRTDWLGVILLTAAMFCLIFGLLRGNDWGWASARTIGIFNTGATLLLAFIVNELAAPNPSIRLSWFRNPKFTGAQIAAFAVSGSILALFLYLSLYLQNVLGYSALDTGIRFLPVSALAFLVAPLAGRLSAHVKPRILIALGLAGVAEAMLLMYGLASDSSWRHLLPGLILAGISLGLINPPLASAAIAVLPPEEAGTASGVNSTFRQTGIAAGIAVLGAVFQHNVTHQLESTLSLLHLPSGAQSSIALAVSSGRIKEAAQSAPPLAQPLIDLASRQAFVSSMNQLFLICAVISATGAILVFFLLKNMPAGGHQ